MNATQWALVTGTTSGIGQAVALGLLERGWRVLGAARRPSRIEHARYEHVSVDLADPAEAARVLAPIVRRHLQTNPRRVGLVNNAASAGLLGPIERIEAVDLARMYALNVITPLELMGLFVEQSPHDAPVRIVNVSSGAAVRAFPGLGAYGSSKAALRMAGMVLATEIASTDRATPAPADVGILSYEPGTVDTPMQEATRSVPQEVFPWGGVFHLFKAQGQLVPPQQPAKEIVGFLEADRVDRFTERRFGRSE